MWAPIDDLDEVKSFIGVIFAVLGNVSLFSLFFSSLFFLLPCTDPSYNLKRPNLANVHAYPHRLLHWHNFFSFSLLDSDLTRIKRAKTNSQRDRKTSSRQSILSFTERLCASPRFWWLPSTLRSRGTRKK